MNRIRHQQHQHEHEHEQLPAGLSAVARIVFQTCINLAHRIPRAGARSGPATAGHAAPYTGQAIPETDIDHRYFDEWTLNSNPSNKVRSNKNQYNKKPPAL